MFSIVLEEYIGLNNNQRSSLYRLNHREAFSYTKNN